MPETTNTPAQWKEDIRLAQQGSTNAFLRLQKNFALLLRYEAQKLLTEHITQKRRRQSSSQAYDQSCRQFAKAGYEDVLQMVIFTFFRFIDGFQRFELPGDRIPQDFHRYLLAEVCYGGNRFGNPRHFGDSCIAADVCVRGTETVNSTAYDTVNCPSVETDRPPHRPAMYAAEIENFRKIPSQFSQDAPQAKQYPFRFHRKNKERHLSTRPQERRE